MINKKIYLSFPNRKKNKKERNLGIDSLRIIAIFFIINHHIIYHGASINKINNFSFKNNLLLFMNTIFCSGVNIFGMISGFVGFRSHNYSNLIYLLFQTFIYNYGIALYYKITKPLSVKDLNLYLYPLFISDYWYFTAYFSMYFFLQIINSGIKEIGKRELGLFNFIIFSIFSCFNQISHYSTVLRKDLFGLTNGFSYIWLIILYFYGGYFGKFNNDSHNYNKFIIFLICISFILIVALLRNIIIINKIKRYKSDFGMLVEYTSPSSVIISICFIIMLSKINIQFFLLKKIIGFFSPLTYGVYLLHNHILVRHNIIRYKYAWILKYHSSKLLWIEFFESSKIFLFCSFIDYFRLLLFKITKIRDICKLLSIIITKIGNTILFIFELLY